MKTPIINRAKVRELALTVSKEQRAGKFKRVGDSFYADCNAYLAAIIKNKVFRHPSVGITLK